MAQVTQRIWKSGLRKVKRAAWGFTAQRDGKQIRRFREDWTKDDAERAFSEWTLGVETPSIATPPPAGMTFGQMVERFLAEKRAEKKRSIKDDEERSVPLLTIFGKDAPVTSITTRGVAEYRVTRLGTKSRRKTLLAPATVNRECALLRSILRMALAWEEITRLPVFRMTKEEGKQRFLTDDEIARLLAACGESRNKLLLAMVTVDLHTGLRKGELLGLTWEQVDFSRNVIALGRRTKSGKGRDVPINQAVYDALAPLRKAAGGHDAAGRVWGEIRKIDTAYNAALLRAKILDVDVNFHTLRHTFASHYVMRGGSLVKLQAILGHASIRTTQVYAHLAPDHLSGATAILEGLGASEINARSTHEAATAPATTSGVV
jgi:integrase